MNISPEFVMPAGLLAGHPDELRTKLAICKDRLAHVVFDFDRTLTVKVPGTSYDVTTWQLLRQHLPAAGQQQYMHLFNRYQVLEYQRKMTLHDAQVWWSAVLDLFVYYRVDMAAVEADFLQRATIRPGTAELFAYCAAHDIPTVILSAGIREVIDLWCEQYRITPSLILSTSLELDDERRVVGWSKSTLVHTMNKSEADHSELRRIRAHYPVTIVVGDSLYDANMAPGNKSVIRVRIFDPREGEVRDEATEKARTFESFDALITSGSLAPIEELLRALAS